MLGKWGNGKYKSKYDFTASKDYLDYMYGDTNGFIARMVLSADEKTNLHSKSEQKLFRADKLISENEYDGLPEVYTSMNSFMTGKSRKVKNLNRLNALFVDIDCYKLNLTQEQAIYQMENDYFGKVIPIPTFIIKSGQGLYLLWKIYKGDDKKAIPKWNKIQRYIHSKLKELGADGQALDAARILRVPFTGNSKNKKLVEIAEFNDVQYTLYEIIKEYDIRGGINFNQRWGEATQAQKECAADIAREQDVALPDFTNYDATFKFIGEFAQGRFKSDRRATANQIKYATKIAEHKGLELPDFNDYKATWDFIAANRNKPFNGGNAEQVQSEQFHDIEQIQLPCHINPPKTNSGSYLDKWREDIENLIKSRKGEDCQRELCLFLHRLFLCEATHDYETALQKTLELNAELDTPFSESYVRSHTYSAEAIIKSGETYKYKKNRIIELLKITDEEMKQLNYLTYMSARERKQRKNRKAYEDRLHEADKKTEKENIRIRRENMAEMINGGKPKEEICEKLNISLSTYYTDRAVLEAEGLVARAQKAIKAAKDLANKITDSITNAIKETVDNYKTKPNSMSDIPENEHKKPEIKTDKKVFQNFQPYYCIWTT